MTDTDATPGTDAPETTTISITRTVRCKLETSTAKNELVRDGIRAYQTVAGNMADVLPSYPEHEWEPHHTHMYQHATDFLPEDRQYKTTLAQQAQQEVAESFKSWRERGKEGDRPGQAYGDRQYLGLRTDDVEIVPNDRGYGVKTKFISYNPVWFHIVDGAFQREFLERICDSDDPASSGSAELHLHDDGTLFCHLTVSWPVETYVPDDVSTAVGIDINEDPLVAAAVVEDDGNVTAVDMVRGREYRHHRERLKRRREGAQKAGNLAAVKSTRLTYDRYTDHMTNVASRRVVDLAVSHAPAVIRLEDLAHYRETAKNPIHDWPFTQIQDKITAKAHEEGLPVTKVDPRGTSRACRQCGHVNDDARDGRTFTCPECGYEVHVDVNAAINIAGRDPIE